MGAAAMNRSRPQRPSATSGHSPSVPRVRCVRRARAGNARPPRTTTIQRPSLHSSQARLLKAKSNYCRMTHSSIARVARWLRAPSTKHRIANHSGRGRFGARVPATCPRLLRVPRHPSSSSEPPLVARTAPRCRVELFALLLARHTQNPAIIVKGGDASPYMISPIAAVPRAPGFGTFTCCSRDHVMTDEHGVQKTIPCEYAT